MSDEKNGAGGRAHLPEPGPAAASMIASRQTAARPIFIQAFWRTGSTYIWKKFRQQPQYRAYYEPLNEVLLNPREQQRLSREGRQHVADEFGQERLRAAVCTMIEQARTVQPKPFDPSHVWSYLLVEKRHPEVLTHRPARHRNTLRLIGYLSLAEEFLGQHRPAEALEQLEHMFGLVRGAVPANALFLRALALMARCCRELGDDGRAVQYEQAAGQAVPSSNLSLRRPATPSYGRKARKALRQRNPFELSVIISTYNRRATLRACLANLAAQSLPLNRWQVIVVDDGSTDGTEELCRNFPGFYSLEYMRQENAGAGAARRAAVERARGEYLLLMNDDTIAHPGLLTEHLRIQYEFRRDKIAVLGTFFYPFEARERALTNFLSANPFLFPQVTLDPGLHSENAYFIACNLSVRRDAVLAVGSFDPHFRVAEDTELGIRLRGAGYRVLYHPKAIAVHDHLDFTSGDLVRRARIYGRTQLLLLRKHPHLLGDGAGPFGRLDDEAIQRIREHVDKRDAAREGLKALEKLDSFDLAPYFAIKRGERSAADEILDAFPRLVPVIFWFFLFESFLQAWGEETSHTPEFSQAILADHT